MKLKRLPEDFRVDEVLSPNLGGESGPFALYKLTKKSLGTLEAIAAIARHWKLPRHAIAFAGLKDKHALTSQHITIHHGQRRGLKQTNLELEYLSQLDRPIHASDIDENRFDIVLRDLSRSEAGRVADAASAAAGSGLPNYFDDQRFGSLGESGEFIALPWCRGDYERALWLALTDANIHDRPQEREEKQFIREHWGNWNDCLQHWPNSRFVGVLSHLASQPNDFRRAIARVPHELRSLWLAAFQSHVWNQILAAAMTSFAKSASSVGQSPLGKMHLPLPSARLHLEDETLRTLYDQALASEGLELREIRVKYPRDSFFSKGERAAVFWPKRFAPPEVEQDELHRNKYKVRLRFSLARGIYATIFVKSIIRPAIQPEQEPDTFNELVDIE